jgi:hypothetical protein
MTLPFGTRRGRCGQMQGRRPEKPEVYSLESGPIAIPEQWVPRIYSGRERRTPARRVPAHIVRRSRKVNVGRAPRKRRGGRRPGIQTRRRSNHPTARH